MQLNECFRLGIVMPLDQDSQHQLNSGNITSMISVTFLPFFGEEDFMDIWDSHIFREINELCGKSIDYYNNESLDDLEISRCIPLLEAKISFTNDEQVRTRLNEILTLFYSAQALARPVFFVF